MPSIQWFYFIFFLHLHVRVWHKHSIESFLKRKVWWGRSAVVEGDNDQRGVDCGPGFFLLTDPNEMLLPECCPFYIIHPLANPLLLLAITELKIYGILAVSDGLGVFKRVLCTRVHPHWIRHCRVFVFSRPWRKNPSHPLRGWSVAPERSEIFWHTVNLKLICKKATQRNWLWLVCINFNLMCWMCKQMNPACQRRNWVCRH